MDFEIGFTDKDITPWGGMALMKKILDHCDIDSMISTLGLPEPGSNRGYKPEAIIKSFLVIVWCGANRFMHTEVTRQDAVIRKIFGWNRICGQDENVSRKYSLIYEYLEKKGCKIPVSDVWIAACCMADGGTLLTRDKHFNHIEQIEKIVLV